MESSSRIGGSGLAGSAHIAPAISSTSTSPLHAYQALYGESWHEWVTQGGPEDVERREEATSRLRTCLSQRSDTLDLSGLRLRCLPSMLPPGLKTLNLSFNLLTALPSDLSPELVTLKLTENRLEQIDIPLPATLQHLDLSYNRLWQLPAALPCALHTLNARRNRLSALPPLPATLHKLDIAHNAVRTVPMLPARLHELNVCANGLEALPAGLPRALGILMASNNTLRRLPDDLPLGLAELTLRHNMFDEIPAAALRLPSSSLVHLEGNPIIAADTSPGGMHPHLYISAPSAPQLPLQSVTRPLPDAVADWMVAGAAQDWQSVAHDAGAAAFSIFLDRLAMTRNAQRGSAFWDVVVRWLQRLAICPALRAQTFQLAQDATGTCDDGIGLLYNQMQQASLAHQVESGELDHDLPAVVRLGRELFRLERLELIAQAMTRSMHGADEIEVLLAYQVMLRDPLELSSSVETMRYFKCANLRPADLSAAAMDVKYAENHDFRAWLLDWPAWRSVLQRLAPDKVARAIRALTEEVTGGAFERKVEQRLAAGQLEAVPDALPQLGRIIMDEMRHDNNHALAINVLGAAQCDALMGPYWPAWQTVERS